MKMLMSKIEELITRESFAGQNGNYKISCKFHRTLINY